MRLEQIVHAWEHMRNHNYMDSNVAKQLFVSFPNLDQFKNTVKWFLSTTDKYANMFAIACVKGSTYMTTNGVSWIYFESEEEFFDKYSSDVAPIDIVEQSEFARF